MKIIIIALLVAYITAYTCYAQGDPHLKSFSGRYYNYMGIGDYFVLRTRTVKVVSRQRSWGNRAAVMVALALKFRKTRFIINDALFRTIIVNGRTVKAPNVGRSYNFRNVRLFRVSYNRLRFVSNKMLIDVQGNDSRGARWPQPRYFNVIIDSPRIGKRWGGICISDKSIIKARGFFSRHFHKRHHGRQKKICNRARLFKAIRHCKTLRFKSRLHFKNCVFDRCHKLPSKHTKRFYKVSKVHKKLTNKILRKVIKKTRNSRTSKKLKRLIRRYKYSDTSSGDKTKGSLTVCSGGQCLNLQRLGCRRFVNKCIHTTTVCSRRVRVCAEFHQPRCVKSVVICARYKDCNCIQKQRVCLQFETFPRSCKRFSNPCVQYKVVCNRIQKVCVRKGKCVCQRHAPKKCVERCPTTLLRERQRYCSARLHCLNARYFKFHRSLCLPYWDRCGPNSFYCTERVRRCHGRRSAHCNRVRSQCSKRRPAYLLYKKR